MVSKTTLCAVYILLVVLPILGVVLFTTGRLGTSTPAVSPPPSAAAPSSFTFLTLVVGLVAILVAVRATGALFKRLGQPRVVGEIFAGIMLGASVFGRIAPHLWANLFPPQNLNYLGSVSQLGLVLFMFLVGLRFDLNELRHQGRAVIVISHASMAVPLFLGVLVAAQLYGTVSSPKVSFGMFALFIGVAMAITAFPVLIRILAERGMLGSPVGTLATGCAAVNDITGWCLLAVVVVAVRGPVSSHSLGMTILGLLVFSTCMLGLIKPLLHRLFNSAEHIHEGMVASSILFALVAAAATEYLGVHALFGAIFAGAIMPKRPELIDYLEQRLGTFTNVILLPLFFAYTGLRMHLGLVHGAEFWTITVLIVATATMGKFGGTMIAARVTGTAWRDAAVLGTLMNTRGLMELVALDIGLDVGIISPSVYSMMVIMALFTTFMTGPALSLLCPQNTR